MRRTWTALALTAFLAAPPAWPEDTGGPEGPFYPDEATVADTVRRIAILPTRVRIDVGDAEAVAADFDQRINAAMKDGPFEVLPVEVFTGMLHETTVTMGGMYDPYTGEADPEKASVIEEYAFREFERVHEFDAYLIPAVVDLVAHWRGREASWYGAVQSPGADDKSNPPGNMYGTLPAASLVVVVIDRVDEERRYYVKAGGVELLSLIDHSVWSGSKFVDVPPSRRLVTPTRNQHAVETALSDLLGLTRVGESVAGEQMPATAGAGS